MTFSYKCLLLTSVTAIHIRPALVGVVKRKVFFFFFTHFKLCFKYKYFRERKIIKKLAIFNSFFYRFISCLNSTKKFIHKYVWHYIYLINYNHYKIDKIVLKCCENMVKINFVEILFFFRSRGEICCAI